MNRGGFILRIALFCQIFVLSGCLPDIENGNKDWTEIVFLTVASEFVDYHPIESSGISSNGLRIKEDNMSYWMKFALGDIENFDYEVGYEYRLKVLKTHLANPPMDSSNVTYKLISVVSKEKCVYLHL